MNRNFLFLTSLSLIATPFVYLVAAPATAMPTDRDQCPSDYSAEFVHALTKNFSVRICGGDLPHVYVALDKNTARRIILPLADTSANHNKHIFVAVKNAEDGYYSYVLTDNRLTVQRNGKTIVSEKATWVGQ